MNQFLCVLAIFEHDAQRKMEALQQILLDHGFMGLQTMDVPFHITLGTYDLDRKCELIDKMNKISIEKVSVFFGHHDTFHHEVLYLAPNESDALSSIKEYFNEDCSWVAHTTILMDDADNILGAVKMIEENFKPFDASIESIALYEFFPSKQLHRVALI